MRDNPKIDIKYNPARFFHKKKTFCLTLIVLVFKAYSQKTEAIDSTRFRDVIKDLPSFTIYGDNYFITGTSTDEHPTSSTSDTKIQIGFKQRITNNRLPWDTHLFFTYKQKAFWDTYKESLPFRETNYNPGLAIAKPFFRNGKLGEIVMLQYEHESNGRDLEHSRSWNYLSLYYMRYLTNNLTASIKIWIPIGSLIENPEIINYRGNQQLEFAFKINENIIIDSEIRKTLKPDWKGSLLVGLNFRMSKKSNQFIYLQYYLGYSESLMDYNKDVQKLRIGIAFKDLFLKFRK